MKSQEVVEHLISIHHMKIVSHLMIELHANSVEESSMRLLEQDIYLIVNKSTKLI